MTLLAPVSLKCLLFCYSIESVDSVIGHSGLGELIHGGKKQKPILVKRELRSGTILFIVKGTNFHSIS